MSNTINGTHGIDSYGYSYVTGNGNSGGSGGAALSISNSGTITDVAQNEFHGGTGGSGGVSKSQRYSTLVSTATAQGTIFYGISSSVGGTGGSGGEGVSLPENATFINNASASVVGGAGGSGGAGGYYRQIIGGVPQPGDYYFEYVSRGKGGQGGTGGTGFVENAGTVLNYGAIVGGVGGAGADLGSPAGAVGNGGVGVVLESGFFQNSGVIQGGLGSNLDFGGVGVWLQSGTFLNGGTIDAASNQNDAVILTGAATVVIEKSSDISGLVVADTVSDDVLLAGSGAVLNGLGDQYLNFSEVGFCSDSSGTIISTVNGIETTKTWMGIGSDDSIIIESFVATSNSYSTQDGLILSNSSLQLTLTLQGEDIARNLRVEAVGDETIVTDDAPCFLIGTHIRTPNGNVSIEDLNSGDLVCTAFHGLRPIKWIGYRTYRGHKEIARNNAYPICIKSSSIADGVPSIDLYLSPDHLVCENGVLVPSERLVNGVTILKAGDMRVVDYIHLELEEHGIIFAEDCPVESFLDLNCRHRFDNASQYSDTERGKRKISTCLPRVDSGFPLLRIQQQIMVRAGIAIEHLEAGSLRGAIDEFRSNRLRGWIQNVERPEDPVWMDILIDGIIARVVVANGPRPDLRKAGYGRGFNGFDIEIDTSCLGKVCLRRSKDHVVFFGPVAEPSNLTVPHCIDILLQ